MNEEEPWMNEVVRKVLGDTIVRKERAVIELRNQAQQHISDAQELHAEALILEGEARAIQRHVDEE